MKKLTSYQKLKAENLALKQDVHTLVMDKDPISYNRVKTTIKWKLMFEQESIVWRGETTYHRAINGND